LLATDVTEQQQMASELAAKNADLIQLNRLKDEFLACISHELRTPLTAMLGLSTLLKDQALGQLNERQARYARLIHENGRHLMSVVNDILDLTRMETGQLELTLEPAQIRKVCDRAIEQARAAIQPKTSQPTTTGETGNSPEHRFTLLIEPGLDIIVVDELRLRQMLVHLLANAFKFTELEGDIGLRVSYWAGWIAFTVWDTGIGIPEHQQHLIFQKFQQLENPLTRQFEGTGLGLVLTRTLARLHGGDVSFLSKEGKGSQFTLLLPPSPPQKRAGEPRGRGAEENSTFHLPPPTTYHSLTPNSSHENRRNDLVLVVEAVPRFIEDLADQLTSLGYWVAIARSGTEALEKARRLQPGTIFLNPLLPLLSGWDVLTLLKSDAATSQIPVIVTTTRAEKAQALSHRADEFLSLPVKQQVLQQVMTRFCGSPSVSRSRVNLSRHANNDNQLTILRLVAPQSSCTRELPFALTHASLLHCRVLEADDIEQAELLARIWQPDVVLLEREILDPLSYLQQLSEKPSLAELPIVTLDVATTQAANQVEGLSVFPCLTTTVETSEALLSVLQIAAGISREYGVLVVDVTPIEGSEKPSSLPAGVKTPGYAHSSNSIRSEWLQALIQYLHTAGFRGVMAHSWEEVQQQIQQQSVDVILICLGESKLALSVLKELTGLGQQYKLPPVLVMERGFSQSEVREQFPHYLEADEQNAPTSYALSSNSSLATAGSETLEFLETVLGAIATKILPSSLSMEELLENIYETLLVSPARRG
jgi:CheY-like chemotaxis protein